MNVSKLLSVKTQIKGDTIQITVVDKNGDTYVHIFKWKDVGIKSKTKSHSSSESASVVDAKESGDLDD